MKSKTGFYILITLSLVAGMLSAFLTPRTTLASSSQVNPESQPVLAVSPTGIYIIRLQDASVAAYQGGVGDLEATSPAITGARRLDPDSPASQAYLHYLEGKQGDVLEAMQRAFGQPIQVEHRYLYTLNAIAVRISYTQALRAFDLPGVMTVYADAIQYPASDMGPTLIGAPYIWESETYPETMGEGIIIGVIDTGINSQHNSFAETIGTYTHTNPYGVKTYHGWCATHSGFCNEKLIGAYNLVDPRLEPEDLDGHGSHAASLAAGNQIAAEFSISAQVMEPRAISGVAPHANLVAYKVCRTTCYASASVDAVNLAIGTDQVDVLTYAITGGNNPWSDIVELAFLDAYEAGIFVSTSAGNGGPAAGTVEHSAPWVSTVAASTHNRIYANQVVISVEGEETSDLTLNAVPATGIELTDLTAGIVYAGDVSLENADACEPFPAGTFTFVIGLVEGGGCSSDQKATNLMSAGAVGAMIINDFSGVPIVMDISVPLSPVESISLEDGAEVIELIQGDPTAQIMIYPTVELLELEDDDGIEPETVYADVIASFSGRGPSQYDLLKPDYAAPGVNILGAIAALPGDAQQYGFYNGTSMSAAHGAGAAALMRGLFPLWTVAEIRSAMSTTANPGVTSSDGLGTAGYFDVGSGRLDLLEARFAGLIMDETAANFLAANPATGGNPRDLNMPYLVDTDCFGTCEWTRQVTSVYGQYTTWHVEIHAPEDLILTVTPDILPIIPGSPAQTLTITADVTAAEIGENLFAEILLVPDSGTPTRLPVVVVSTATPPVISVDPVELESTQWSDQLTTQTLTISNLGVKDLEWELFTESLPVEALNAECLEPAAIPWLTIDPALGITDTNIDSLVTVSFDSTGLAAGVYTSTLCASSNDPLNLVVEIPVTLIVTQPTYLPYLTKPVIE